LYRLYSVSCLACSAWSCHEHNGLNNPNNTLTSLSCLKCLKQKCVNVVCCNNWQFSGLDKNKSEWVNFIQKLKFSYQRSTNTTACIDHRIKSFLIVKVIFYRHWLNT
jgi:hypothetical protein